MLGHLSAGFRKDVTPIVLFCQAVPNLADILRCTNPFHVNIGHLFARLRTSGNGIPLLIQFRIQGVGVCRQAEREMGNLDGHAV